MAAGDWLPAPLVRPVPVQGPQRRVVRVEVLPQAVLMPLEASRVPAWKVGCCAVGRAVM